MKMLMCTDGSEQADRALRLGSLLAAGCAAEVTLLGINETGGNPEALLDSLRRAESFLRDKKVSAEIVSKAGEPIAEIVRRTCESPCDLVIIGAVRKQTRGQFWVSSKAYKIMKEIKPPVLAVLGKVSAVKRVLICTGGKRYIDDAVQMGGTLARGVGASVTLLHVMPEPPVIMARLPRMDETAAWLLGSRSELGSNLREQKTALETLGVQTEVKLRDGPVLDEILAEVREGGYDLVVTGSAPSRNLRTYVLGDVSREVVNRVDCAVLVVRGSREPGLLPGTIRDWFRRPPR